ncbi:MAG: helix-turn-helix domain-containing protein [Actinomycetota bacterium]|nr:helix-turn-helix domain-containing protein [Actinomycetota bacterium]MDQ3528867.1 helix-turn-helix domain-containing protein [Actinomycetota bacterium]
MTLDDAPDVLTVEQVAAVLSIGRNQAYEAVRRGDIYAVRLGRSLRVPKAAVLRLLNPEGR